MKKEYFEIVKKPCLLLLALLLFSCAPKKKMVYYQDIDKIALNESMNSYEVKIQPDDLLMIIVSANDPEAAIPFNLAIVPVSISSRIENATGQQTIQSYLVSSDGGIEFPILGKLHVGGLTKNQALQLLKDKIAVYIKDPVVNLRIINFKVSVQGEVNLPGTYSVATERIALIEALSMAKDLTIYGRRNNILIIREVNGQKSYNRVDITRADFINSPFYYLAQNDVVYVEPNKTRVNSSAVGPNTTTIISAVSILVSLCVLIFK